MNASRLFLLPGVILFATFSLAQTSAIPPGPAVLVFDGDYHVANCSKLSGQSPKSMALADAMREGGGPCRVCQPNRNDDRIKAFVAEYTTAISLETVAARRAAAAERAAAERKRVDAAAAVERKRRADAAEAERRRAEAELRRREAEPLVRLTETQARFMLAAAATKAGNDLEGFTTAFLADIKKAAPDFRGPQLVPSSDALTIAISGPLGFFYTEARERVRKFEPLTPPPAWSTGVHILVNPSRIDAPDIEKIVVQRNGVIVPAVRTGLQPREMISNMGAKRMIHGGEVIYPLSAFEPGPGVSVTVIAVPASGSNIIRKFGSIELRAIQ